VLPSPHTLRESSRSSTRAEQGRLIASPNCPLDKRGVKPLAVRRTWLRMSLRLGWMFSLTRIESVFEGRIRLSLSRRAVCAMANGTAGLEPSPPIKHNLTRLNAHDRARADCSIGRAVHCWPLILLFAVSMSAIADQAVAATSMFRQFRHLLRMALFGI
jgi:hypothetical protein